MPVVSTGVVLALVRGDDRLDEAKLAAVVGAAVRPAQPRGDPRDVRRRRWLDRARGTKVEIVADETLREGQYVAGANRTGWHLRGVEAGRDYDPRFADIRETREGDECPKCGGALALTVRDRGRHIFKLETRYSEPLEATFLDEDGQEKPIIMGSYGIGPARTMAAVVEQHHDEQGIKWPAAVAPYDVHVSSCRASRSRRSRWRRRSRRPETTCSWTTATSAPGEKFADADLIGIPVRVTVGQEDARRQRRRRARPRTRRGAPRVIDELGSLR